MPISIDYEECAANFLCKRIGHIHAHHEVRREIRAPWPRVIEIVFGVERVVADETAEDAGLDRQTFSNRCKIRDVGWPKLPEKFVAANVWRGRGKAKYLRVFPRLRGKFDTP